MTFLGPLLFAAFYGFAIWMVTQDLETDELKRIVVIDEYREFENKQQSDNSIAFEYIEDNLESAKSNFINDSKDELFGILLIPSELNLDQPDQIKLFTKTQASFSVTQTINTQIKNEIENIKLGKIGIDKEVIDNIKTKVRVSTVKLTERGQDYRIH